MLIDITKGKISRINYNNLTETLTIVYSDGITKEIKKLPANEYSNILETQGCDFEKKLSALGEKYGIRTLIEN